MNSKPTVSQILKVEHLLAIDHFDPPTIVRLTSAQPCDAFRIASIDVGPDGTVIDGQHRLSAARKHRTRNLNTTTPKGTLSMPTKNQNAITEKERDELVDFGIEIGQVCWQVYRRTKTGYFRLFKLPSNAETHYCNEKHIAVISLRSIPAFAHKQEPE